MSSKICVIGSSNIDQIAYTKNIPADGETLFGDSFQMGFGGKGANQAVMAGLLGADVYMITCLGDDVYKEMTINNYEANNVNTDHIQLVKGASGVAPIWVDATGQNRIIVPNENEFELISGMEPNDDNFLKFNEEIPCNLIVTLGEKGAVLVDENKTHYFDAPSVNAIDTTGAGDSFIGTFAYELSESNSPESCIKKAVEKASQSVTKKGTQSSYS